MKEEWKVYIRGNKDRGEEVIKVLTDLVGGIVSLNGSNKDCIYFIDNDGTIDFEYLDSEEARNIMDNYTELRLPEQWKDGDILKNKEYNNFVVYKRNYDPYGTGIYIYLFVNCNSCNVGSSLYVLGTNYRLATPSEIEDFHNMLQTLGYDWDCDNKQLVDSYWKPKYQEIYYYITEYLTVCFQNWADTDIEQIRWRANNCFKTKEEAEYKANKIKDILKEKHSLDDITTDESHCR